jgi:hypothetical protein
MVKVKKSDLEIFGCFPPVFLNFRALSYPGYNTKKITTTVFITVMGYGE